MDAHPEEVVHGDPQAPAHHGSLLQRWRQVYRDQGSVRQATILAWAGFAGSFGMARGITHWLKGGHGPASGGFSAGGHHLHHYNFGIALLGMVGAVGLRGGDRHRRHPVTAVSYGVGWGLIVDELALLLDLEDVYWAQDGRKSVDTATGVIALGGLYLGGVPFWHGAVRELKRPVRTSAGRPRPVRA
ncbi:MAG: hypothetical protein ACRDXE_04265 [Acidimicrobiales bacterium]